MELLLKEAFQLLTPESSIAQVMVERVVGGEDEMYARPVRVSV